jgi:hypothetical protein
MARLTFFRGELLSMAVTMLVLGVSLALAMYDGLDGLKRQAEQEGLGSFWTLVAIFILTTGLAVAIHEIAGHKWKAQRLGIRYARFEPNYWMLAFSFIAAAIGMRAIFMSSGHVAHDSAGDRRDGRIALAGPVANLLSVPAFLAVFAWAPGVFLKMVGMLGALVSAGAALFNLAPFWLCRRVTDLKWAGPLLGLAACIGIEYLAWRYRAVVPFFIQLVLGLFVLGVMVGVLERVLDKAWLFRFHDAAEALVLVILTFALWFLRDVYRQGPWGSLFLTTAIVLPFLAYNRYRRYRMAQELGYVAEGEAAAGLLGIFDGYKTWAWSRLAYLAALAAAAGVVVSLPYVQGLIIRHLMV